MATTNQINWTLRECAKKDIEAINWNQQNTSAELMQRMIDCICKPKKKEDVDIKLTEELFKESNKKEK